MTKSELIEIIAAKQSQLSVKDVELAVKTLIEQMSETLAAGERIEIRGFGSFSLHYRAPRIGRNPKTGESVGLAGKYVPHFKPGKELRDRVNKGLERDRLLGLTTVPPPQSEPTEDGAADAETKIE
jgi:integration host factor subunit beta